MSELKFTCPTCGQHIQCETAHAGENIPCPGCAMLVRIPTLGTLAERVASAPAPVARAVSSPTPPEPLPLAERERKIAEARQKLEVSIHTPMKPRLSVILSENARTVSSPGLPPPPSKLDGETEPPSSDFKTLSE